MTLWIIKIGTSILRGTSERSTANIIDTYCSQIAASKARGDNLILVSNTNYDHSSRDKIKKIRHDNTEVITTKGSGYKGVKYDKIVALLIEAVKEQQEEIEELKKGLKEVSKLKIKVNKLSRRR